MCRNVAILTNFLVELWLLKLPKQHFNLALLIFNIAKIIRHLFTFLGYILEKYGHFLKNLVKYQTLGDEGKKTKKKKKHILFSHFEKEFSQLAKSNHKNKTLHVRVLSFNWYSFPPTGWPLWGRGPVVRNWWLPCGCNVFVWSIFVM